MTVIAIYAEGGGNTAAQKEQLRQGFDGLLRNQKSNASQRKISLRVVCAGGRDQAYGAFSNALIANPDVLNVLLVDSETQVTANTCSGHLSQQDGWDFPAAIPERVHLMAQCMETWIVADADALAKFYGQRFARNALPVRQNLEEEPKKDVYEKLEKATRETQKGKYGKMRDSGPLLQRISPAKVEQRCPRFVALVEWLDAVIQR